MLSGVPIFLRKRSAPKAVRRKRARENETLQTVDKRRKKAV